MTTTEKVILFALLAVLLFFFMFDLYHLYYTGRAVFTRESEKYCQNENGTYKKLAPNEYCVPLLQQGWTLHSYPTADCTWIVQWYEKGVRVSTLQMEAMNEEERKTCRRIYKEKK